MVFRLGIVLISLIGALQIVEKDLLIYTQGGNNNGTYTQRGNNNGTERNLQGIETERESSPDYTRNAMEDEAFENNESQDTYENGRFRQHAYEDKERSRHSYGKERSRHTYEGQRFRHEKARSRQGNSKAELFDNLNSRTRHFNSRKHVTNEIHQEDEDLDPFATISNMSKDPFATVTVGGVLKEPLREPLRDPLREPLREHLKPMHMKENVPVTYEKPEPVTTGFNMTLDHVNTVSPSSNGTIALSTDLKSDLTSGKRVIRETKMLRRLRNYLDRTEKRLDIGFARAKESSSQQFLNLGGGCRRAFYSTREIIRSVKAVYDQVAGIDADLDWLLQDLDKKPWPQVRDRYDHVTQQFNDNQNKLSIMKHLYEKALRVTASEIPTIVSDFEDSFNSLKIDTTYQYQNLCELLIESIKMREDHFTEEMEAYFHEFYRPCQACKKDSKKCNTVAIEGCDIGDDWTKEGDRCFKAYPLSEDWYTARTQCWSLGADLVTVNSGVENTFLTTYGAGQQFGNDARFWIGAYSDGTDWYWTSPSETTNWDQEDELILGENRCAASSLAGNWSTLDCLRNRLPFVCVK